MDKLIPAYVHFASRHLDRDNTVHNDDQLQRFGCIAARSEPAERARFLELLHHEHPVVRYTAAVHALGLGMAKDEPLEVLRALAAGQSAASGSAGLRVQDHEMDEPVEL